MQIIFFPPCKYDNCVTIQSNCFQCGLNTHFLLRWFCLGIWLKWTEYGPHSHYRSCGLFLLTCFRSLAQQSLLQGWIRHNEMRLCTKTVISPCCATHEHKLLKALPCINAFYTKLVTLTRWAMLCDSHCR